jgi:hypothetical protein
METILGGEEIATNPLARTKSLVSLILLRLDEMIGCIEQIHGAFRSEDIHLASSVLEQLQRATSHAYVAILTLEQHTGCRQINARSALAYCRHLTRMPQSLAWSLISQLPSTRKERTTMKNIARNRIKLMLSRETLRALVSRDLRNVVGHGLAPIQGSLACTSLPGCPGTACLCPDI